MKGASIVSLGIRMSGFALCTSFAIWLYQWVQYFQFLHEYSTVFGLAILSVPFYFILAVLYFCKDDVLFWPIGHEV